MPATTTTLSVLSPRLMIASMIARVTMPFEHPGHQSVLGVRR